MFSDEDLVNHLRRGTVDPSPLDETACGQLERRACAIAQEQTPPPTISVKGLPSLAQSGPTLPSVFGPYVLLEQLGQGGMGIVYKARQEALKRFVALKLVRAGIYANAEERTRFQREGEVIARIRHPHVVQIHDFGEQQGQLHFAMELLEGGSLAERLKNGPLPQREAAELMHTLARAVEAAHQQGVVHRDLKPGNVLLTKDGTPKITDFGLAKILDDDSSATCTDAIMGTPAYMSPEQARGESRLIGPAADVYALGVMLYEMLTGQPPFRAETRYQTLELVRQQQPEPPSLRCKELSRHLDAICLKCLPKNPTQRYNSAAELAEELDRYLRGEKPKALEECRLPNPDGAFNGSRTRKIGLAAGIAGLAALSLFGLFSRWFGRAEAVLPPPLVLLDENTAPLSLPWVLGEKTSELVSVPPNGVLRLRSKKDGYLELCSSPPWPSYRLEAEIQDEEGKASMRGVGIFFSLRRWQTPSGPFLSVLELFFSENGPSMGHAYLMAEHYEEAPPYRHTEGSLFQFPHLFRPVLKPPMPRRRLAVEVRGSDVFTFWEDQLIRKVSGEEIEDLFERGSIAKVKDQSTDWFDPKGGIGVFVSEGTALFHRLELKPLPPER